MSNTESMASPPPEAGLAPGQSLRMAREARGESRAEVAQALKLSLRQVEALERGEYDALPGPAFVRGFLRNYARHLGLDAEPLLAALTQSAVTPVELAPVSNAAGDMPNGPSSRNASGPAATVALVLLLAVLAGWYFDWFQTEPPPALVEGETEAPARGDVAVEPVTPPAAAAAEESAAAPVPVPAAPPVSAPSAPAAAVQPTPEPPAVAPAQVPPPLAPVPSPAVPATPAGADAGIAAPAGPQLVFRFAGESWIEVRDASGAVVYSGIGASGSSRNVQGKPPFALVVGNAKDVRLEFNGREIDLQPHTRVAVARLTVQ